MKSICRPICLRSSSARRVEMQLLSSTMMAGYPSARQDGIRRGRDGLALVQAVPQDVVAWPSLFGRHQQLLEGTRATNDVRTLLAPSRGTGNARLGGRVGRIRF